MSIYFSPLPDNPVGTYESKFHEWKQNLRDVSEALDSSK